MKKTFDQKGDFEAVNAAERWCRENGISIGSMQVPEPRGLLYGDYVISKWRNMSTKEKEQLDGTMTGNREGRMRYGPITINIKDRPR